MIPEPVQFLFSENINIYIQSFGSPFFDILFKALTNAGAEPSYIFLASLIFWCHNKKTGILAMYVILFSALTAIFTKNLLGMPRPPEYLQKIPENGFGFPSAHATVSSGFWGYLGGRIRKRWFIIVGATAIVAVSFSRIYLGVHYAGDVIGGIFFGLMVVLIFFKAEPAILAGLQKLSIVSKYFVAVVIPVIFMLTAAMQRSLVIEQMEIGIVMLSIGIGYLLEEEHICFEDARNNKQRFRRAFAGVFLLAIVYLISHFVFSDFIFFKYPALGLTSTFLVPWVISRIELSNNSMLK